MGKRGVLAAVIFTAAAWGQDEPASRAEALAPSQATSLYLVRASRWSDGDEREFSRFIAELGDSGCSTVNRCLRDPRNPYRGTDPAALHFFADCADLPYYLRFYFASKRGLPFSFASEVEPRGRSRDIRYTAAGNSITGRRYPAGENAYAVLAELNDAISSATYRVHPELETPEPQDFYSPALKPGPIRPGTVIYDPNGHLALVWKIEANGRIHYMDAHPDGSVTRGVYDLRFVRASPGMGAGFKNWRPQALSGARKGGDGVWRGGAIVLTANKEIADFGLEQFFGNGPRPASDRDWHGGLFSLNGETVDYYDYLRGQMAGGKLSYDPLREVGDLVDSNCADLQYRADAVTLAVAAGLNRQDQPARLPANIYGTEGDWETYSTPSRDARLKTAFKELADTVKRFVAMARSGDRKLAYKGKAIASDMLAVYNARAALCTLRYKRSNGSLISFGYEEARRRLFDLSFDPYHCPERRWGARDGELSTCPDGANKAAWYAAERGLRNQIDRTYETRMDFSLRELQQPGPGKGVAAPPDTDARSYLQREAEAEKSWRAWR